MHALLQASSDRHCAPCFPSIAAEGGSRAELTDEVLLISSPQTRGNNLLSALPVSKGMVMGVTLAFFLQGGKAEAKREFANIIAKIFNQPGQLESNTTIRGITDCRW